MESLHGVHRKAAAAGAVVAALTTGIYVAVIVQESDNPFWAVVPWVMIMLLGTFAALAAALAPGPRLGRSCALAAVAILASLGLVAIFSVGIGFIVAAGLVCVAAVSHSIASPTS